MGAEITTMGQVVQRFKDDLYVEVINATNGTVDIHQACGPLITDLFTSPNAYKTHIAAIRKRLAEGYGISSELLDKVSERWSAQFDRFANAPPQPTAQKASSLPPAPPTAAQLDEPSAKRSDAPFVVIHEVIDPYTKQLVSIEPPPADSQKLGLADYRLSEIAIINDQLENKGVAVLLQHRGATRPGALLRAVAEHHEAAGKAVQQISLDAPDLMEMAKLFLQKGKKGLLILQVPAQLDEPIEPALLSLLQQQVIAPTGRKLLIVPPEDLLLHEAMAIRVRPVLLQLFPRGGRRRVPVVALYPKPYNRRQAEEAIFGLHDANSTYRSVIDELMDHIVRSVPLFPTAIHDIRGRFAEKPPLEEAHDVIERYAKLKFSLPRNLARDERLVIALRPKQEHDYRVRRHVLAEQYPGYHSERRKLESSFQYFHIDLSPVVPPAAPPSEGGHSANSGGTTDAGGSHFAGFGEEIAPLEAGAELLLRIDADGEGFETGFDANSALTIVPPSAAGALPRPMPPPTPY